MLHALLALTGAFALFLFEPFLGKALTPRYGGGAQVWLVCLLFFQVVLLLGYAYGHYLGRLPIRRQAGVHAGLLALALGLSVMRGGGLWLPPAAAEGSDPALALLGDLLWSSALPLILLSATSPLAHRWFSAREGASPYHLYAWSNAGSLVGLLAFPLVVEPRLSQGRQAWLLWGLVLAVLLLVLVLGRGRISETPEAAPSLGAEGVPAKTAGIWVLMAALGSAALVAATAKLSLEVGSIPLLWILPLLAYLLSFILVFDARWPWVSGGWRPLWLLVAALGLVLLGGLKGAGVGHPLRTLSGAFLFTLALGLVCHGRLYERRPPAGQATLFLLATALGGALGGLAMTLGAPLLLSRLIETGLLAIGVVVMELSDLWRTERPGIWAGLGVVGLCLAGGWVVSRESRNEGLFFRNFYGILRLEKQGPLLAMTNLQTLHGAVDRSDPGRPLTYYTPESGLGRALAILRGRKPSLRVCVLGLGVGSAATYGEPGDTFDFLELNPLVGALAGPHPGAAFPCLGQSRARVRLRLGDGRNLLEADRRQGVAGRYDLLLVDAFAGDSVPWHLLTEEALDLYLWHLAPEGILLAHVSNPLPVDLVVLRAARARGLYAAVLVDPDKADSTRPLAHSASQYVLLARAPGALEDPRVYERLMAGLAGNEILAREPYRTHLAEALKRPAWRDDRSSLTDLLRDRPLLSLPASPGRRP